MIWFHVAARVYARDLDLDQNPIAPCLWRALRRAFPEALSAVIMGNHTQLVTPGASAAAVQDAMRVVVSALCRSIVGRSLRFEPVPVPTTLEELGRLLRDCRYVALNPARAGLVRDPLAWYWSTHRDVVGAVADPWVTPERLATTFGRPLRGFVGWYHDYVSVDRTTDADGTPPPRAAAPTLLPVTSLGDILLASAAARRGDPSDVRRRGLVRDTFFTLAAACGWRNASVLAAMAGSSRKNVWQRRALAGPPPDAAWLCLGDRRLLVALEPELHRFLRDAVPAECRRRLGAASRQPVMEGYRPAT
jgi:hypothetical protein